jgi:cell division protein FtsA
MIATPYLIGALDIGSTKTCAVIGELILEDDGPPQVKVLGVGQVKPSRIRRDAVSNLEETTDEIRQALKQAELMAGIQPRGLYVGISAEYVQTSTSNGVVAIGGDEISEHDIERVHEVARAVVVPPDKELLHVIPQDYSVDHRGGIQQPVGMLGTRLEADVFMVLASGAAARNLRKAVTRAGYEVAQLVLTPLAAGLSVLTAEEREVGAAVVAIGGRTTEIAVFHEGKIRHVGIVPCGGVSFTNDLVKGLGIPYAEAERVKERHGVATIQMVDPDQSIEVPGPAPGARKHMPRELLAHIIEQRMDEILTLVLHEIDRAGYAHRLGGGVVLTGGGASLDGTLDVAQTIFSMPVRCGAPGAGLTGLADSVRRPKFATAAGLMLFGVGRIREDLGNGRGPTLRALSKVGGWLKEFF